MEMKKNAIIMTWDGVQDQELIYPYYRLKEAGFDVNIYANQVQNGVVGLFGIKFDSKPLHYLKFGDWASDVINSTILVVPGGVKSLEKLRQEKIALELIQHFDEENKVISSTCHGAQMLISAKVVKGKTISGYYSIKDDIENAGATYLDAPYVISGNIISSPHYKHMGPWMAATLNEWENKYGTHS